MSNRRRWLALFTAALCLVLNVSSLHAQESGAAKVAVLPFQVNAGDDLVYLKDSLPSLFADRMREQGFEITDQDIVQQAIDDMGIEVVDLARAREIALLTDSDYVLYGAFSQLGESLSIESRLVEAFGKEAPGALFAETEGIINLLPLVDDIVAQAKKAMLDEQPIVAIDVEGTQILDKEVVLMRLGFSKGDTYEPSLINRELKNIYGLGYFEDVQVVVSDVTGGKKVVFRVKEKPRIQALGVVGADELDEEDILEAVATKKGAVLNLNVLRDDLNTIRALYRAEGYYKTKVSYEVEGGENGQARLNFVVEEGPKLYIEGIILDGAEQLDPDDIRDELALSESGFFSWFNSSDVLNEELLERDAAAIKAYYGNRGFLNVQVGRPEVDFRDDGIYVTFRIEEGQRVKIGSIQYKGDLIASPEELDEVIALDETREDEEYLNTSIVREDIEALTSKYSNQGYAYADVGVQFMESSNPEFVDVIYTLTKHQKVHIRRVLLEGNAKTRDNVILRDVKLSDGDTFSGEALEDSIVALEDLGYFEAVDIEPIPTGNPDEMDLKVRVKEGPTGQIGGGMGFSSSGGVFVAGSIQENNLFGKGYTLGFSGSFGGSSNEFSLSFIDPHYDDQPWGYSVNLSRSVNEYDEYDIRDFTVGADLLYPLGDHTRAKLGYSASFYSIYDVEEDASDSIKDDEGEHLRSAVTGQVARSHLRRTSFFINEGTAQTLSVTYGGGILGGDDHYIKYIYDIDHYEPLFWDMSLNAHGNIGYVHENFGGDDIPTAQRFRLGGIQSVRGYSNRKISPRDNDDDIIGGNKSFFTNLELLFPMSKEYGLLGILFFDAGNAWDDDEMFFDSSGNSEDEGGDPSLGLYKSVGLGGRWNSPMGPLEIYWGYGLDDLEDSTNNRLEFRMGQTF